MKKEKPDSGFVYIWFDRKHKRYYIGSHWGTVDDGYVCSSNWMLKAYRRRPEDFKRRILSIVNTSRMDLLEKEYQWLNLIVDVELGKKYYNLNKKVHRHLESKSSSIREKISEKLKYRHKNDTEFRKKYLESVKNRDKSYLSNPEYSEKKSKTMLILMEKKFPKENRRKPLSSNRIEYIKILSKRSKEMWERRTEKEKAEIFSKISASNKGLQTRLGQKNSEEHKHILIESNKNRIVTEETRKKMSLAKIGHKQSIETIDKRVSKLKGQKRSADARALMSEKAKNRNPECYQRLSENKKKQSFTVNGIFYRSYSDAALDHNCSIQTVINRLKSPSIKFSNWVYINNKNKQELN